MYKYRYWYRSNSTVDMFWKYLYPTIFVLMLYSCSVVHARCDIPVHTNEFFFCVHVSKDIDIGSKCYILRDDGALMYMITDCNKKSYDIGEETLYYGNIPSRHVITTITNGTTSMHNMNKIISLVVGLLSIWKYYNMI